MSIESSDNGDSADIFWPGYVDAVTNLVLNLLFVLTIMIVAVFMFTMELSRVREHKPSMVPVTTQKDEDKKQREAAPELLTEMLKSKDAEIEELQKQLLSLKKQVQLRNELRPPQKVATVKTPLAQPEKQLDQPSPSGGGVIVNFMLDAVTISASEAQTVRGILAPVVAAGSVRVEVTAPAGFSEAKRLAFYRAMAVRNMLIELNLPPDKIEVSVREGAVNADNTKVLVTPRR